MLKKILLTAPAIGSLAAITIKNVDCDLSKPRNIDLSITTTKIRPSELPLYSPITGNSKNNEDISPRTSSSRDAIESVIRRIRTEVQSGYHSVEDQVKKAESVYDTAVAHTQQTIDYLNEPQNMMPRIGAIAVGGLAGFILAARGGFIKKIIYTSIGAGGIAALCYPAEAEVVAREAYHEVRKGGVIVYNFVTGAKPGDEPEDPFINLPTNLEDFKHLFWDLYDEAKAILTTEKKK